MPGPANFGLGPMNAKSLGTETIFLGAGLDKYSPGLVGGFDLAIQYVSEL